MFYIALAECCIDLLDDVSEEIHLRAVFVDEC